MFKDLIGLMVVAVALFLLVALCLPGAFRRKKIHPPLKRGEEVQIEVLRDIMPPPRAAAKTETARSKRGENRDDGEMPPLSANYRARVGFKRYAEEMRKLGAAFVLMGEGKLFLVDMRAERLVPIEAKDLAKGGFSPRSRVIADEPEMDPFLEMAARDHHVHHPEVLLLVPGAIERKLSDSLQSELSKKGLSLKDISGFQGEYYLENGALALNVTRAIPSRGGPPLRLDTGIFFPGH